MTTTPIHNATDTWNDVSTTFNAIKVNVTDTASADASKLFLLQVGGVDKFAVDKSGAFPDSLFAIADNSDRTKKVNFQVSGVTTGTTRTITVPDADITLIGAATTDTLTNKTIDFANNTVTGTLAEFNAAISDGSIGQGDVTLAGAQTLTNKTIDADNNTISNLAHGAEVDNPSSGVHGVTGSVVGTTDTQTLTNKTLTSAVLNTGVSGTAILDEDNMASNSATQLATQQSIKAYVDANGGTGFGAKFEVVEPGVSAAATRSAIETALSNVGTGGTVMLAPGDTFEIDDDIAMSTDGQTIFIPAGTTLQSTSTNINTRQDSITITGEDCVVMGNGTLDRVGVLIGSFSIAGEGKGARVLGDLKFKNAGSSAIIAVDCYDPVKPIIVEGAHVFWDASGVTRTSAYTSALEIISFKALIAGQDVENLIVRDCTVDFESSWSIADVVGMSSSPIGIRINVALPGSIVKNWKVTNCRVMLPEPDDIDAWETSPGSGVYRDPTCYEIKAAGTNAATIVHSTVPGGFPSGETVTGGSSGATAVVSATGITTTSFIQASNANKHFEDGETLTVSGGSGKTAAFVSRAGHLRDGVIEGCYAFGGALQFSLDNGHNISFNGNRAVGNCTDYCLEYAGGDSLTGSGNHLESSLSGKTLSTTNTREVNFPGNYIGVGANSNFTPNTGITVQGVNSMNLSVCTIQALADNANPFDIYGGTAYTTVNLSGTTWIGTGFTGINAIHFTTNNLNTLNLTGATFIDIDTNSILIDSGRTLDQLITVGCSGFNAGGFTNNGNSIGGGSGDPGHIDGLNIGISGLSGQALVAANNLSDLASASTARTNLGLGTIATQAANSVDIDGGAIDGTVIGGTTPAAGTFSDLDVTAAASLSPTIQSTTGNVTLTLDSDVSNSTTTGLYIDTVGDSSIGRVNFGKAGVTRGVFSYTHGSTSAGEVFGVTVAGGTEKLRVTGDNRASLLTNDTSSYGANNFYVGGTIALAPASSVTPQNNGDVMFELTNNTTLTIKAKGSDGNVRSGTVTLA